MAFPGFYLMLFIALAVLFSAHFYVAVRVVRLLPTNGKKKLPSAVLAVVSLLLFLLCFVRSIIPMPAALSRALGIVSFGWMGIFLYLLLFLLLSDAVLLIGRLIRLIPHEKLRKARIRVNALAIALALLVSGYGFWHAQDIQTPEYEIRLTDSGSEALTIALVSDLHLGAAGSEVRLPAIVDALNDMDADVVLIAGDLFDNDFSAISDPERAAELIRSIKSEYGVYACFGNHDAGSTETQMLLFLEECGVTLLRDKWVAVNGQFALAGRCDSSPIGNSSAIRRDPEEVLADIPADLPVVVMDHNPTNIREYDGIADLIVSGHTHRGQIFPGSLVTRALYAVDYGYYRAGENSPHVIVTSGAGTWGPPMRVGTDAEVVKISLYP